MGNVLHGIPLPDLETASNDDLLRITWARKKLAYVTSTLPRVGGKSPEGGEALVRSNDTLEAFCYWALPKDLLTCLVECYFAKFVFDLIPSEGNLMFVCLLLGIPYLGIAFTEEHREACQVSFLSKTILMLLTLLLNVHFARCCWEE